MELSQEALAAHLSYCTQHCNSYYLLIDGDAILPFLLANFCGLSTLELQSLPVDSDLASIDTRYNKLTITDSKWKTFITLFRLNKDNGVEKNSQTSLDVKQYFTREKSILSRHHLPHVGKKINYSPRCCIMIPILM